MEMQLSIYNLICGFLWLTISIAMANILFHLWLFHDLQYESTIRTSKNQTYVCRR